MSISKYSILITNDDGPESPFLIPFLDAVAVRPWCKELRVVVPCEEQSWIAGSITRFKPLFVSARQFGKHSGFTVSGTPSDCASLGIFNLYASKPDFVFSGINMGTNAGLPYFLSSGTVAGAVSASLAGLPAIAVSALLPPEVYQPWAARNFTSVGNAHQDWKRLSRVSVSICETLISSQTITEVDLFSINIPWEASENTRVVMTRLEKAQFQAIFTSTGPNQYRHRSEKLKIPKHLSPLEVSVQGLAQGIGDLECLERKEISVTPICYNLTSSIRNIPSMVVK